MQTDFTETQLQDPLLQMSEGILRKCVHCGMCLATCPSYLLLGDEADSPRGRIYQIKAALEGDEPASPALTKHMDRCLSCLNCVTTCPSGVQYQRLADYAREKITTEGNRSLTDKFMRKMVAVMLPNRRLMQVALPLGKLTRPLTKILSPLLPSAITNMLSLLPDDAKTEIIANTTHKAEGEKIGSVGLLPGCVQQNLAPQAIRAAVEFLNRHGLDVTIANADACCGSLAHHMGYTDASHKQAKRTIDGWNLALSQQPLEAILHIASGCGTTVKDYDHLFAEDDPYKEQAQVIASLAKDISEYIYGFANNHPIRWRTDLPDLRITYHSACSLRHGQKINVEPLAVLKACGLPVSEPKEAHICCGSAGTYNIFQGELAEQLKQRKLDHIAATSPDVIVTGNIGCIQQLVSGTDIPVIHTIEFINWASGGAMPESLANHLANRP